MFIARVSAVSLAVLLASCSASLFSVDLSGETASFENDLYGYAFEYPDTLEIEQASMERVSVSVREDGVLHNLADIRLLRTPEMAEPVPAEPLDRLQRALVNLCSPSDPFVAVYCKDATVIRDFKAANGMAGSELRVTEQQTETGKRPDTETKGPILIFDISANFPSGYAYLAIGPAAGTPNENASEKLVRSIANSFRLVASGMNP